MSTTTTPTPITIDTVAKLFSARMRGLGYTTAEDGAAESRSRYVIVRFVVGLEQVERIDGSVYDAEDTETVKIRFADHAARYERDLDVAVERPHDTAHLGVDEPADLDAVVERAQALMRRRIADAQ